MSKKFRVKATETWYWDIEIEAESRMDLAVKLKLHAGLTELCDYEHTDKFERKIEIEEV